MLSHVNIFCSTEENAVNLVYGFLALHDNFDLAEFDEKRQGIMTALISCVPRKAAPYVQSFHVKFCT